jgi:hypothetical protein
MVLFARPAIFVIEIFLPRPALFVVLEIFLLEILCFLSPDVRLSEVDKDVKALKGLKLCD